MIPLYKLARLPAGQRRRKLALLLSAEERSLMDGVVGDEGYILSLIEMCLEDEKIGESARNAIRSLTGASPSREILLRACDQTRHSMLAAIGTFPAEWDLLERSPKPGEFASRFFFSGMRAYAEDIRSPFNLGSIFRTAEAFGAERLFLSPNCVPPEHARARRSAMGCVDYLPWERLPLESLPGNEPVFALETGGTPIDEFDFPPRGTVIIGSEELGVSPEGLARASYGRVSIPMRGIKASVNVGVAFGILMNAWASYLACSAAKPV
jgi:RNA methyltransferase, TrmH family